MARKILLADDSVTAQNMGRRILSDAGYEVITVNNGSAALKKIAELKPDLIVLDVYMPGYGGLEVCQRLREAPETARIPVLLTVGKLEPFKADEARRVRADGFIVKPFEASELLTALTKLEDKIVPQSQPSKPSRFAKALAGVDDLPSGKEFGDSETGWKNRLSIPPPHSKARESEPEEPPVAAASVREAPRAEAHKPAEMKSGLEEAMLSSMPQDVTAEEIAAIKAAAAAINLPGESSFGSRPGRNQAEIPIPDDVKAPDVKAEELPSESAVSTDNSGAATFASGSEQSAKTAAEEIPAPPPPESSAPPVEAMAAAEPPPMTMAAESPAGSEPQVVPAETGKLGDEEVTAALASLAPANGHGPASAFDGEAAKSDLAAGDRLSATKNIAASAQQFNGPRWIAESVAVMDDEATLVLEHEMERAYAAFAAADAARMSCTSLPAEPYASLATVSIPATNSGTDSSPADLPSNLDSTASAPQESMSPTVAMSSEEPAMPAHELTAAGVSAQVSAVSESAVAEVKEGAAYTAAASASPSSTETVAAVEAESVPPVPESSGRQGESELAAAWANWRQIRESVIGSQPGSQIADAVADLRETSGNAQPEAQPDSSSATGEEAREIANIVDSVLADLKPKLMAEIARKMGKEKNK